MSDCYQIVFTEEAKNDLNAIHDYLSQFYPSTSMKFFSKLKKQVLLLQNMPQMCPLYEEDPFFRQMIIGDYLLFYSVNESDLRVIIHRIFHSKRDISKQILG